MDREQRISCFAGANPRRSQAGTGLRPRSRQLPGRGSRAALGVRVLGRDSDGPSSTGRESKTHASHPRAEQASPKPLSLSLFLGSRTADGLGPRARCQVRGAPTLGRDGEGRRSGWPSFPGHFVLPTSPIPPATFDLASRTHGGLAQGQGGDAQGIETRGAAARSAPGRAMRIGGVRLRGPTWEVRSLARAPPPYAASRGAPGGRRRRAIYKCKGLIVVLCSKDTIVYSSAGLLGVFPGFAARTPLPAPKDLLSRANPDLSGCPRPSLT